MRSDECRQMAAAMRKQAARAKDLRVQAQMLIVAKDWDRLAKNADELERRRSILLVSDIT